MNTTKTNSNESKSTVKNQSKNVYQIVTGRIVEQMKQGVCPWRRPWQYVNGVAQCAVNYKTGKPYSMINQWLLGYRVGEYLTYKQATELGGKVKKGAKAGMVVFWASTTTHDRKKRDEDGNVETDEDGNEITEGVSTEHTIPVLKYYMVYHIDDIEGVESKYAGAAPDAFKPRVDPIEAAEDMMWQYVLREEKLTFQCDKPSNKAFYSPATDKVVVPMLSQYDQAEEFYSTAFHELVHSTLPTYRCNRKDDGTAHRFGDSAYSREELVAEIGSAMLCNIAGLDCDKAFKNSVAYIKGWLKHLKDNPKWIVWAASRAEKATRYIQYGPEANAQA